MLKNSQNSGTEEIALVTPTPVQYQAIIWTNNVLLLMWPLGTNVSEIWLKTPIIFLQENLFENIICKMAAILSWPQCFNWPGVWQEYQ